MKDINEKRGILTLKIDGKDINLLFSMNFWRLLDKQGIQMESLATELDGTKGVIYMLESLSKIVSAAGKSYATKYKTSFDYDIDTVFDWFSEDINQKTIDTMIKVMMDTRVFGSSLNQGVGREDVGKKTPS